MKETSKTNNLKGSLSSDDLITRVMNFRDSRDILYTEKFNVKYVLDSINKLQIQQLDSLHKDRTFNILNFVRYFVNSIPHEEHQTLYLVMAIIELYHQISQQNLAKEFLDIVDITNYICNKILIQNNSPKAVEPRHIPLDPNMVENYEKKSYISNPPLKYGAHEDKTYKLSHEAIMIDKNRHGNTIICTAFSLQLKRIFSLEALTQFITLYDQNCKIVKTIRPSSSKLKKDVVILCFAFSQKQQRLGAVLKDYSLNFWDAKDNFEYEKTITTTTIISNCQTNIWYLQKFNEWVTADRAGVIYVWNLIKDQPQRTITCKFKEKINSICEIPSLNLLAVVQEIQSSNKQDCRIKVIMYNFQHGQIRVKIQDPFTRIPHSMQFSNQHQVLLTAGFQKTIKIYQINPKFFDCNLKGELIGHDSLITCFCFLQNTPLVISSDDKGKIKMWDIRSFNCLQTLNFCEKSIINRVLDMVKIGKVGFFGSRINIVSFQDAPQIVKQLKNDKKVYPLKVDYDDSLKKLIVLTEKDLRIIDLRNGAISHLFCSFVSKDDDITFFKYFSCLKKFVIGNQKGQTSFYNIKNGKYQQSLSHHDNAVSAVQYDDHNRLFLTASFDSNVFVHKIKQQGYQKVRQFKNNFNGNQIIDMQLSVYHSLVAVLSNQSPIYIWDYEMAKILAEVKTEPQSGQITAFTFINAYCCLVVGTSSGLVCVLKMKRSTKELQIQQVWRIQTNENQLNSSGVTHFCFDSLFKGLNTAWNKSSTLKKALLYIALKNGQVCVVNFIQILNSLQKESHVNHRSNYNPQRQIKQNFVSEISKKKLTFYTIKAKAQQKSEQKFQMQKFKLHQDCLTSITIIQLDQHLLLTSSVDKRVKIWKVKQNPLSIQKLCDTNINWPLPYQWNLYENIQQKNKMKDKIMFALKVVQSIFKKYSKLITIAQARYLKVQKLFNMLQNKQSNQINSTQTNFLITQFHQQGQNANDSQPTKSCQNKILLQDEFKKNDLHYKSLRKFNFTEVAGPTLREMDIIKKHEDNKKQWKIKQKKQYQEKERLMKLIQYRAHKTEEKEQVTHFLTQKNAKKGKHLDMIDQSIGRKLNYQFWNYTAKRKQKDTLKNVLFDRFLVSKSNFFNDKGVTQLNSMSQSNFKRKNNRMKSFQNYYDQKRNSDLGQKTAMITEIQRNSIGSSAQTINKTSICKNLKQQLHKNYNYLSAQSRNSQVIQYRKDSLKKQLKFRNIINEMNQKVKQRKINNPKKIIRRLKTQGCQRMRIQQIKPQINKGEAQDQNIDFFSFLNSLSK